MHSLPPTKPHRRHAVLAPRSDRERAALGRHRKWRRRWLAVKAVVAVLVLLAGAAIYLQSGHALQHLFLPWASRALGTSVTAQDGSAWLGRLGGAGSLGGSVELQGLEVLGSDGQPALTARSARLRVPLASLLGRGVPVIEYLKLESPTLSLRVDAAGKSNWSFLGGGAKRQGVAGAPTRPPKWPMSAIRVDHFALAGLTAQYENANGLRAVVEDVNLMFGPFAPGENGDFDLNGKFRLERADAGIRAEGLLGASGYLRQAPDGERLDDGASIRLAFRPSGASDDAATSGTSAAQGFLLAGPIEGSVGADGSIRQRLELATQGTQATQAIKTPATTAQAAQATSGTLLAMLDWNPAANKRSLDIQASIGSPDLLNPLLALLAPVQLADGTLEARVQAQGSGEAFDLTTSLRADRVSFASPDGGPPTPPLSIRVDQAGDWRAAGGMARQARSGLARLRRLSVAVARQAGAPPVLEASLDRSPLFLALGDAPALATGAAARVRIEARALPVAMLRPWLTLAGVADGGGLTTGTLNGQGDLSVADSGQSMRLEGSLRAVGVEHQALPGVAFAATDELRAELDRLKQLKIEKATLAVALEGRQVAEAELDGALTLGGTAAERSGQARARLSMPGLTTTLRRLGILKADEKARGAQSGDQKQKEEQGKAASTDAFSMDQTLRLNGSDGSNGSILAEGQAHWDGISAGASPDGKPARPLAASAVDRLRIGLGDGALRIDQLRATIEQPAPARPGTIELQGRWTPGADETQGGQRQIHCVARGVDLGAWARRFHGGATINEAIDDAKAWPSITLDADQSIERREDGALRLEGHAQVSLPASLSAMPVSSDAATSAPARVLAIKNTLDVRQDRIERLTIEATSKGNGAGKGKDADQDRFSLEGSGEIGEVLKLSLTANVERLKVEPYLAAARLLTGLGAASFPASPGAKSQAAVATVAQGPSPSISTDDAPPSPLPLLLDVQWNVGKALWRGLDLADAAGSARLEKGYLQARLDRGKLAGGPAVGQFSVDLARRRPRWAARLGLRQADAARVFDAVVPNQAGLLTGVGSLEAQATGQGPARDAEAHGVFEVKDGRINDADLAERLSALTGSDAFRDLRFDALGGAVDLADGVGKLKDGRLVAPDKKLAATGTFDVNGGWRLSLAPSVAAKALGKGAKAQRFASLAADKDGWVRLPLKIEIESAGKTRTTRAEPDLAATANALGLSEEEAAKIDQAVRGALGGLVEKRLGAKEDASTTATQKNKSPAKRDKDKAAAKNKKKKDREKALNAAIGILGEALENRK
jgi:uncharacterized protein involved in outer membrane biogenesis